LIIFSVNAAKPHFSNTPTITKNSDLSLTTNFKAAAIGKKAANVTVSSLIKAELGCVNPGGNSPPSKTIDFEQMQDQSVNIKLKDDKIKGSVTLPRHLFPPHQTSVLIKIGVLRFYH
jgi:hypothetical protein